LEVAEQLPNLFLLMVGDGAQKQVAVNLLNRSPFKHRVILLPFRNDVPALLHAADVFVLPSLWEGMPIALLEAMSMGKAIIATKVDGTKEFIEHGKNGWLVQESHLHQELSMAIKLLEENESLRISLGVQARETVQQQWSWEAMTQRISIEYKKFGVLKIKRNNLKKIIFK
jgi:glycosyltransferase involved in cell wall biosynthesis